MRYNTVPLEAFNDAKGRSGSPWEVSLVPILTCRKRLSLAVLSPFKRSL